jgi:polyisoprenoid-binding protein YceI
LRTADCFDAEKFPAITFKSTSIKETKTKGTYLIEGDLTMHGTTKKVVLNGVHTGNSKNYQGATVAGLQVTGVVKRADFGIVQVSPGLSEDVKLQADLEVVKN